MDKSSKLAFLTAPRFIAMVIGAVAIYCKTKGWIGEAEMNLIGTLTAGFVGVATIDRISDKVLEGKKVTASTQNTTVSMPSNTTVTATNEATPGTMNTYTNY